METMAHSRKSVEELFEAALARAPEERLEFLDSECSDSPQVRKLVEMLLEADGQAGSFLESPLLSPPDVLDSKQCVTFEPGCLVCGRFQIHRFIAKGGMGEVYEAWDSELRERVAIKTIRPDLAQHDGALARFRREVKQARSISHPNICRIHELFCHQQDPDTKVWFLSMEFLDGFTLSEHIAHFGAMKPELACDLVEQIISGLTAAHSTGVIHRDLKSGNIMLVSGATGRLRAVITDFGLAFNVLHRDGTLSEPGGQGTPEYMPPEQRLTGEVSALADQYALGVIMCEMLTGSRPTRSEVKSGRGQLQSKLARSASQRWSRVVVRCLEQEPKNRFENLGEVVVALKPIERPRQRLYLIALGLVILLFVAFSLWHRVRPAPPDSVAVLPLENHTGDASLEYVGAGITEALTDDLARMPGLHVAAASVARRFRGPKIDPTSAGKEMHVGTVLSGSLEKSGQELRVPVEVIDVSTGQQLWGQTYEVKSSDIVDLQHQISTDLAYRLKVHVDPSTADRLKRQYSTNPEAYNSYLKGRFQMGKRTSDGLREAVVEFQRALTFDPHYAPALAGLADCYSLLAFYGFEPPIALLQNSLNTSQEALRLDSTLAEAYASRALARSLLNFDWAGAEADYKRAIELNPNYVQAHAWYALDLLTPQGRQAEARAQMKYVQSADPDSPLAIIGLAMIDRFSGRTGQSIRLLEPQVGTANALEPAVETLSANYIQDRKGKRAIEILRSVPVVPDAVDSREALLAVAYAQTGETEKANDTLRKTVEKVHAGQPMAYETAEIYTALGDRQKAIEMLQTALDERESELIFVNVNPLLAPLRAEPQFQSLLTEMNLRYRIPEGAHR